MSTETFETIRQWAHSTFGVAAISRTVERTQEEFDELQSEVTLGGSVSAILEEAADVVITLCNLPGLADAVDRKMAKNRSRQWAIKGDGTGYHIKEATV